MKYQGQWYPGTHKPLVDRVTWNTVQVPLGEIDDKTMAAKATELRDQEAHFKLQLDACDLGRHENGAIAVKAFELSQNLREQWVTADYSVKRRYLEILFLNFVLDDVTLVPTIRKPFDVLAEGLLVQSSRGDKI